MMRPNERARAGLGWLALVVVPLVWIGPSLRPGFRFLPQLPVQYEPLASERPADAERARRDANWVASDRIFPLLATERAVAERVRAGQLPTWDPLAGTGAPLAATSLSGTWYPPRWLGWWIGPARAGAYLALFRLIAAGTGLWLLLGRLGLGAGPRIGGALALQVSGFAFANLHYGSKLDAALWLPWSLWALEGLRRGARGSGPVLALATTLSFLAGFVSIALFQTTAVLARALSLARSRARLPLVALGWVALGLAGAAVELVPAIDANASSTRTPQPAAAIAAQALPAGALATLLVPDLLAAPTERVFAPGYATAWWLVPDPERAASANPLEWQLFAGVVVLGLAAAAWCARPRRAAWPTGALLAALAFAFGLLPARWLYELPPFALGAPARALAVAWIAWAWLAALGLTTLAERRARVALGLVAAIALSLGALASFGLEPAVFADELERTLVARHDATPAELDARLPRATLVAAGERLRGSGAGLTLAGLGLLAVAALAGRRPRAAVAVALVALGAEGALHGRAHLVPRALPRATGDPLFPPSPALEALARAAGDGRVVRLDTSPSGVADVERLARPNLPAAYGVADLTPYTAFPNRRTTELLGALDPASRYRSGASRLSTPAVLAHPALDLLRVTAVLSTEPVDHPRLEPRYELDGFRVHHRRGALPLARLVPTGTPTVAERAALELWSRGSVDPARTTVLPPGVAARSAPEPFDPGSIVCERSTPDRLDARVASRSGGWLVFHEAWDDGWRATVDGEERALVRADWNARALFLEPGEHVVRTRYEPASLRVGAGLTILALATLALSAWRARRCTSRFSRAEAAATPA